MEVSDHSQLIILYCCLAKNDLEQKKRESEDRENSQKRKQVELSIIKRKNVEMILRRPCEGIRC